MPGPGGKRKKVTKRNVKTASGGSKRSKMGIDASSATGKKAKAVAKRAAAKKAAPAKKAAKDKKSTAKKQQPVFTNDNDDDDDDDDADGRDEE